MKIGIKVGDIMTRNFVHVGSDAILTKCAKEMVKKKVGSLIIRDKRKLNGLLTHRDILRAVVEKKNLSEIFARNIMNRRVATIKPEKDLYEALMLMNKRKTRWLPVINNGNVVGMLTMKDILKIEPTLLDTLAEVTEIKESAAKRKASRIKGYKRRTGIGGRTWIREGQCNECGEFDALYHVDGELLCEDCRDAME